MMRFYQPLLYVWVLPATLIGLSLLPIVMLQRGKFAIVNGVLEIHGGIVTKLLNRGLPFVGPGAAMTLGHVIWGCNQACLNHARRHEQVHVAQYEKWGPFFLPLYLFYSVRAYWRGEDPYRDNPFEREAYAISDLS